MRGIGLLLTTAAVLSTPGTQVADCQRGPVTAGSGSPDWRRKSLVAGPLGVFRHPLDQMSDTNNDQLIAKMPVLVEGDTPVTLRVPPGERHRVFLYYGRIVDRSGNPTTQIGRARGFTEVVFEPCTYKPRTVWPGGIRVRGRRPVRLVVSVEGRRNAIPLRLGRPKPYAPA
jgi:hypothetical protein